MAFCQDLTEITSRHNYASVYVTELVVAGNELKIGLWGDGIGPISHKALELATERARVLNTVIALLCQYCGEPTESLGSCPTCQLEAPDATDDCSEPMYCW